MVKKKILIFSLGPIFKDYVHGGSQKVLREVAIYLGKLDNEVNIYCNYREDNKDVFQLSENVKVHPKLNFKSTYPSAYKTNPFNLLKIHKILDEQIKKHDIFYIHDAQINFPYLHNRQIPTIVSFRDYLYPETLIGAFNFRRDEIIVNSKITYDNVKYTIGNFLPGITERMTIIPNGFDYGRLQRKNVEQFKKDFNLDIKDGDKIILFPNRPEPSKGIFDNLEILSRLVNKHNMINLKLLIPKYIDLKVSNELVGLYKEIDVISSNLGISKNIIYHDWIPYDRMQEYFSLGDLTLSIGNFVEGFGSNSSVESLACGTPVILSNVGAQRNTLSDDIVPKVDYGDYDKIEEIALSFLRNKDIFFDYNKIRKYLKQNFNYNQMVIDYANIILNSKIKKPLKEDINSDSIFGNYILAPWCSLSKYKIYCDYDYGYIDISSNLYERLNDGFIIYKEEFIDNEIEKLIEGGYIVKND